MKWLLLGGLGIAAYFIIRGRASVPVTIKTPEGEEWKAVLDGTYILTR